MKYWRYMALCLAAAFALTGCGEKEPDFTQEDELPYGATMRSDKNSFAVPVTYDRRFLDEAQITAVTDILCAIQNCDAEQYLNSTPEFYAAYQLSVYECESYDTLVENFHTAIAENAGEDFTFNMVLINGISTDQSSGGLSDALTLLDGICEDGKFSDTVENAWDLTVEWDLAYQDGESYAVVDEEHIYLFQTADGCLCVM